jgi:hypothetical protein
MPGDCLPCSDRSSASLTEVALALQLHDPVDASRALAAGIEEPCDTRPALVALTQLTVGLSLRRSRRGSVTMFLRRVHSVDATRRAAPRHPWIPRTKSVFTRNDGPA